MHIPVLSRCHLEDSDHGGEYAVEVDVTAGVGANWFFMRRHDMLQIGTATQFGVPGGELEILGIENYTFGGVSFAGQAGSASGDNSWN